MADGKLADREINTNLAAYYFHQGTNYRAYEYFGCHEEQNEEGYRYSFRVWAPNADSVRLVADFTSWDIGEAMYKITDAGIWELVITSKESLIGRFYKYKIWNRGNSYYKADPYAFYSQTHKDTASIVSKIDGFNWNDSNWISFRKTFFNKNIGTEAEKYYYSAPLNIYEMHLGSWKRNDGKYLNYREIADELAPYVKKNGLYPR